MHKISLRGIAAFCFATSLFAAQPENIRTFTFQEFEPDGVPKGWQDDTAWADVDKTFAADRISEEQQVAKITLERVRAGRMQMRGPEVLLKGGRVYTLRIRMKAEPAQTVDMGLREMKPPFKAWAGRSSLKVTPAWQTFSFSFDVPNLVDHDGLILSFSEPGTLWLDSIQIQEETRKEFAARSQSEMKAGNLLDNGDFRLGNFGWDTYASVDRQKQYPLHTGKQYSLEPPLFEVKSAEGIPHGRLTLTPWRSVLLSNMANLKIGAPFEAITNVRRTMGSGPVQFKLFSPAMEKTPSASKSVGTEWEEIKITGSVPYDLQMRCEIAAQGSDKDGDALEIAWVTLQQKPSDKPTTPVFGVEPDREMSAYVYGETPVLSLLAAGLAEGSQSVKWKLVDSKNHPVKEGEWKVSEGSQSFKFANLAVGWYQLQWQAPWAENSPHQAVNIAVVPDTNRTAGDASRWGIHVEGGDLGVRKMQLLGAHWLRLNNPLWTKWTAVQPTKDTWVFPDEFVEKFVKAGLGIVGNLDRTPMWASRDPKNDASGSDYMGWKADLPNDWAAWEEYVRQMTRRYRDTIHYWEIWNEPDIQFLNPPEGVTNAQAYLQLLEHSAPIIKEENPAAQIIASPAYILKKRSNPNGYQADFTQRLLESGAIKFIDIVGIHYYLQPGERLFDHSDRFTEKLDFIRHAFKEAGKKPVLWNSEWGIINFTLTTNGVELPSNNGLGADQSAQELVAWSAAQLAAGIEKLFWYDGQDNFYYHYHVTKSFFDQRQPKPTFVAYAVLTKVLDGANFVAEEESDGKTRVLSFAAGEENIRVAYAAPGESGQIALKDGEVAIDYLGRELPADSDHAISLYGGPVYLLSKAKAAVVLGK